jgi:hypothetical protein
MTKAIDTTALAELLAKHDANLVASLLAEVDLAAAIEKKGNNVELRKAAHRKNLAENNKIELAKVGDALKSLLPRGKKIAKSSDSVMEVGLTEDQAVEVMHAYTDGKLISEAQTSIQELIKTLVFRSMDLAAADSGEEFPEHTNMVLDVPETGKRFCREGAGRKEATVDFDALRAAVGPEVFAQITAQKVEITYKLDESALASAVLDNPDLLEQVRSAVLPGDWKSSRLMVRDIPVNEKE